MNQAAPHVPVSLSSHLIEYDNLSIKLFSQLAQNALNNISSSAGKMLDVACLFFDKDASSAILDFHKLYMEQSHLCEHKSAVNQQADDIFLAAQDPNFSINDLAEHNEHQDTHSEELANIQKNLEALIQQDVHIKQRMVPVMQCMQYEDIISNRIQRLIQCWEYMVSLLNSTQVIDINIALLFLNNFQSSIDEHKKFYQHVLHADYDDFSEQENYKILSIPHEITSLNTLLERFFEFSQDSLDNCIDQTQHAFDELLKLLNLVTGESEDVAYLFTDSNDSLIDIKQILINHKGDNGKLANLIIKEIAATREKHNQEAGDLIQSFMMALQSQDIIRQNIENVGRFQTVWSEFRHEVNNKLDFNPEQQQVFGQLLMDKMTSHAEREIITSLIPGVQISDVEDDDGLF